MKTIDIYKTKINNDFDNIILTFLIHKKEFKSNYKLNNLVIIKKNTKLGLRETKNYLELLKQVELIDKNFVPNKEIELINNFGDIIYMVDNNLTIKKYLRTQRIEYILKLMEGKL